MKAPRTGAQRQAAHKARMQAAGLVRVSVWVPVLDAPSLSAMASLWVELHARKRTPMADTLAIRCGQQGGDRCA